MLGGVFVVELFRGLGRLLTWFIRIVVGVVLLLVIGWLLHRAGVIAERVDILPIKP